MASQADSAIDIARIFRYFGIILGPERSFFRLAVVYGLAIGVLTLAAPLSVQMLINTVANTGLQTPLFVLSSALFLFLLTSSLLTALREHVVELFGRRFFARMSADIAVRAIFAQNPFFQDDKRADVFNRFFEIPAVQKSAPSLLIGGFTISLQATSGFILVSFYHPMFLAFNLIVIAAIACIWWRWGYAALRSSVGVSHAKYAVAHWLENIGASNGFYKSERHVDFAIDKTDELTRDYIAASRVHFRRTFAQSVSFLLLYALSSAGLLALGGWLVIREQLSLGQLVAAELVLSSIFLGISQFGSYLTTFYALFASVEELALFHEVKQEAVEGEDNLPSHGEIVFNSARGQARTGEAVFDMTLPAGARVYVRAADQGLQILFTRLLKRHREPDSGAIRIGDVELSSVDGQWLRREIVVLQRPSMVESTIRDYLRLSAPAASIEDVWAALACVGLDQMVASLPRGLDTELTTSGWPLSVKESMMLKLAAALLSPPAVLVLGEVYDLAAPQHLEAAIARLPAETSVILFSYRPQGLGLANYLWVGADQQIWCEALADFDALQLGEAQARPPPPPSSRGLRR